ncbi:MAG: excinuclease ABC subunit UvrC [Chromatiales bacterium]|nr:MAG: excinuclease ABC subunit UvrC [Chromatiales bacterium]
MDDAPFDAKRFLATLTHRPGVYRMLDAQGQIVYVGKARDLKRRVASYFGAKAHHPKTQALMRVVDRVEVTVTASEQEALLLEYTQIQAHAPRYNVLYRDDKSYPYIRVTTQQEFPRFEFHRGSRKPPGRYFGPYPSAGNLREVLGQLQKLFQVRQCRDSFFANRSRPCLQHQIQRCTAPCVGLVSQADYARDVENAMRFLSGRNEQVLEDLVDRMEAASDALDFEGAARIRDQIAAVRQVQATQIVAGKQARDLDVIGAHSEAGVHCVALVMVRAGRVLGTRALFPKAAGAPDAAELLEAFIAQHYFEQSAPPEVLVSTQLETAELLGAALTERAGHRVAIHHRVRGTRRQWLEMAADNARESARLRLAANAGLGKQFTALGEVLDLDATPQRIECFDISHTGGEGTVASCVVWNAQGPLKSDYRRYNIREAAEGDDYGAMTEVVRRRYLRVQRGEAPMPDLILIDGGPGQLRAASGALEELQFPELPLVGVAKGAGRKPGREQLYRPGQDKPLRLAPDSPALHLVQQVRDEAHRFAITGHRQRRGRARQGSALEQIAGVGPQRRRALLQRFGGLQGLKRANVEDLANVPGISRDLAQRIFDYFHGGAA